MIRNLNLHSIEIRSRVISNLRHKMQIVFYVHARWVWSVRKSVSGSIKILCRLERRDCQYTLWNTPPYIFHTWSIICGIAQADNHIEIYTHYVVWSVPTKYKIPYKVGTFWFLRFDQIKIAKFILVHILSICHMPEMYCY